MRMIIMASVRTRMRPPIAGVRYTPAARLADTVMWLGAREPKGSRCAGRGVLGGDFVVSRVSAQGALTGAVVTNGRSDHQAAAAARQAGTAATRFLDQSGPVPDPLPA
ncbi:hypothetical protein Ga0074812_12298 [Parafrankia irregularis]|uniref:Uncharacterized protein n=1 Tax=Parafrankia irregularis TaxID=795642 RepID=A0A0S4QWL5_9ACTN|nr:hypothetical protein [Parafrankia irregularis]CUU58854.1 hypothetical protein Ga0074812_12298 [Parafrankia irregularis]